MPSDLRKKFLETTDGSDREKRQVQKTLLESLANKWDDNRIHVVQAPVATGKSMANVVIQNAIGAHIITPANTLVDQYSDEYPKVNVLKGKVHYQCQQFKFYNCAERKDLFGCNCSDCHYKKAKERALAEPTFFNPMSLYYTLLGQGIVDMPVRIIDEAHSLLSLLSQVSTKSFAKDKWEYPDNATNEVVFTKWLYKQIVNLDKLLKDLQLCRRQNHKKITEIYNEVQHLKFLYDQYINNMEQFILFEEMLLVRGKRKYYLKLAPVTVPRTLVNQIFGDKKVILMSGTMFSEDIRDLVGEESYTYHEVPSCIPKENRPIYFRPTGVMNCHTTAEDMFNRIDVIIQKHLGLNILIHVTYSVQEQIYPLFAAKYPLVYANTDDNKDETIEKFKATGGIFISAGCSEGLDFKDDICRVNIIPKLDYLNMGDRVIQKRRALPNGEVWYASQVAKLFCQRYGRSTRHEKDWSYTYCLDPLLPQLIKKVPDFPNYVKEAIVWTL